MLWNIKINNRVFLVVIILLVVVVVLLFNQKNKFENRYNEEFYFEFNSIFFRDNSAINTYINILDKGINSKELTREEVYSSFNLGIEIYDYLRDLKNFDNDFYGHEEINLDFNNYNFEDFIFSYRLEYSQIYETANNTYLLKEKEMNKIKDNVNNYWGIIDLIERFKVRNKDYLKKMDSNKGKNFVKDGVWIELYNDLNKYIKDTN